MARLKMASPTPAPHDLRRRSFLRHREKAGRIDCPWEVMSMEPFDIACTLIPDELSAELSRYRDAEEFRLRLGQRPTALIGGQETAFSTVSLGREQLHRILEIATGASLHASAASMVNGFIPYRGLRIGICGEAAISGDRLVGFRNIRSLAIRIPKPCSGACLNIARSCLTDGPKNTLIVAPPGVGKTSLLRELIRLTSEQGRRVGVIDERDELSGSQAGADAYDLGPCSDVLIGLDKLTAAMMLLRGMNPEVIAMDEITASEDLGAVRNITGCGVFVYATAHGSSRDDMLRRALYRELLTQECFELMVMISIRDGRRAYSLERL